MLTGMRMRLALAAMAAAAAVVAVTGPPRRIGNLPAAPAAGRPNIVFILTDDLTTDLVPYMPHVRALERRGLRFANYFVSDSLCCPSRASIFTGQFPHDTGIVQNVGRHGGYLTFERRGEARRSFPLALSRAGYATAMMGKYLNGYLQRRDASPSRKLAQEPPGWSDWAVAGWGYPEFDYLLDEDGSLRLYGSRPSDYLTDVLARKGVAFVDRAAQARKPFFLELSTFAPHYPYVPAPRDAGDFSAVRAPRPPSFNVMPTAAPRWLAGHRRLGPRRLARLDAVFRRRVEAVQAVDRMIGAVEAALAAHGLTRDTYVVFSSDNGFHIGEYRLMPGKMTAFDTDIRVPLIVAGPGVPPGRRTTAMAENVDLAETFAALAGTRLQGDGRSLVALLHGQRAGRWRNAVLVEHHGPRRSRRDPDLQQPASGNPTTYRAMRTHRFLYVEYADGERELYDLRHDPYELDNIAAELTARQRRRLHTALAALHRCHGASACWRAGHVRLRPF
jgi:N-acetylglucosamine-6-sulfatase